MKLNELLKGVSYVVLKSIEKLEEIEIHSIACYSKYVENRDVFVCVEGVDFDGHRYISEACLRGAVACIVSKEVDCPDDVTVILVSNTRKAHSKMAATYFGNPAERLKVIGVTGTKGKTSVTQMIAELLQASGKKVGRIGTLGIQVGEEIYSTKNTTPDAFTIQKYFAKMIEMGCEYAVIEVSSQSMKQYRVYGILFEAAVFTNFSPDHIGNGEHASLKEYRYFKSQLFKQAKRVIGNLDDIECGYMFRQTNGRKYGYSCRKRRRFSREQPVLNANKIQCLKDENGPYTSFEVNAKSYVLRLPGIFNVYNMLAAMQTLYALDIKDTDWQKSTEKILVNGRMQRIYLDENIVCYIDYAHNSASLYQVLTTMKCYEPQRVILVFGCGGNRAKSRRFEMGKVAGEHADLTIVTSDNPRYEEPEDIIADIVQGIEKTEGQYQIIINRADAIKHAIMIAEAGDIVIVAGKGHENYQEIQGKRYPMSDQEFVIQGMKEKDISKEERCTQILL